MLKEGTIPIVDQPLIQAVKYALDQLGVNPDTLPKKKRRTCLEETDREYTGYLKAVIYPTEKKLGLVCGFDRQNEVAGFCFVNGKVFSVTKNVKIPAKEGFLMLKAELGKSVTLGVLPGIPDKNSVKNTDYHPIAIVKKIVSEDKENFTVFQVSRWEFPQLWIFGECGENEDEAEE